MVDPADVEAVFQAWRARQKLPAACRLTTTRRARLEAVLGEGYTVAELVCVIEYVYESTDRAAKWMRGETPDNPTPYTDLDNLFRDKRVSARVETAAAWALDRAGGTGSTGGDHTPFRIVFDDP